MRNQRKARKNHRCAVCGRTITKGTEYIEISGWEYDRICTDRLHIHCDAVVKAFEKTIHSQKATGGNVRRWIGREVCEKCHQLPECGIDNLFCQAALRKIILPQHMESALHSAKEVEGHGKPARRPW